MGSRAFLAALGCLMVMASSAASQSACRQRGGAALLAEVRRYSTATEGDDAAVQAALGLRAVPASGVGLVADGATCARAATAYCAALQHDPDTCTAQVFVVYAADRFVVYDPEYRYFRDRPGAFAAVFDSTFQLLSTF